MAPGKPSKDSEIPGNVLSYAYSYTLSFPKRNLYSFPYFPRFLFLILLLPLLLLLLFFFFNVHVILLFAKKTTKFQEGIPNLHKQVRPLLCVNDTK